MKQKSRKPMNKLRLIIMIILFCVQGMGITSIQAKENCGYTELEKFSDTFFYDYMEKYQIPGAAVSIIQDGKVLFEKGYGYANLEAKEPFTTENTYFSIASITKTFTAIAIMELVQEGKVGLDENILIYLPTLKLDNPYKEPVTVRNLLTHTGGIDSSYTEDLSYEATNNEQPHNLLEALNKRGIHVVSKPSEFIEYSSYGTVLLGAIVEEVSGLSCESYFKEKIFKPLEMNHTCILNPEVKRIQGYICNQGKLSKGELKGYFRLYPEGGIVSSVEEMNHYIKMLLTNGSYNEEEIVKADQIAQMLKKHAVFDEILPGMGLGFAEYKNNGITSMGHAGYSPDGTLSELVIYPDKHIGTFIVVNQGSNNNIQTDFREAFVNEFLADEEMSSKNSDKVNDKVQVSKERVQESTKNLEGIYRFSDYSKTNIYKANTFGMGEVEVKALDEKRILVSGKDDFTLQPYQKEAELIDGLKYQVKDEENYIVFKKNEKGEIGYMAETENSSHGIYEKIKWYEQARYQMPFFVGALGIYLIQLIGAFVNWIRRKVKKANLKGSRESRLISSIAFLNVGFFVYSMGFWGDRLRYMVPLDIQVNLTMPIVSAILTILLGSSMIYNRKILMKTKLYKKIYVIGMFSLSVIFLLFLNYWNFIGYKL